MCGVCGVVSFRGEPVSAERLSRSCEALRHRGPDNLGTWIDPQGGTVGLGAARLSILDPSPAGNQPMHRGRYHLVHNGEIYNFRELRAELSALGDTFETDSDTEVVLYACVRWGPEALNRFNGMWAMCFYDSQTREGLVARDRFGVKPLIYSLDSNRLCFASELHALKCIGSVDAAIDDYAVQHHLQFGYIPHPHTIYQSARRLPPGYFLRFAATAAGPPERFYDPIRRALKHTTNDSHSASDNDSPSVASSLRRSVAPSPSSLRRSIASSVGLRRVSDVPIGAFLSGGLDSSIVVSHLAEVTPQPVKTFCVGFEGHRSFDERHFARLVAQRFGTDHHEIVLTHREVIDSIPGILAHLGEPFGDASIVPTALLSQFARRHVTVALSGDGGDELFAGYWRYTAHATLSAYRRIPSMLRRGILEPALANLASVKGGGISNRVRQLHKLLRADGADSPIARHIAWSSILAPEAERIFADSAQLQHAAEGSILAIAESVTDGYAEGDPLNRILAFDLQYQLPADMLHKVDMASMMHSLEVRVPFLDYRVVEAALGLPSSMKLDCGQRKRILIDAYRGHLPDEVLDRGKQGFELPFGEYLRGPLRSMFEDVVTPAAVARFPLLSYAGVRQVFDEHHARRADHTDLLFALLSLCWWRP